MANIMILWYPDDEKDNSYNELKNLAEKLGYSTVFIPQNDILFTESLIDGQLHEGYNNIKIYLIKKLEQFKKQGGNEI